MWGKEVNYCSSGPLGIIKIHLKTLKTIVLQKFYNKVLETIYTYLNKMEIK